MNTNQYSEGEELTEEISEESSIEAEDESTMGEVDAEEPLSLEDELAEVQAQAQEYLDGWQRARAELQNYKKRVDRERDDMHQLARITVLGRFLDLQDDFTRAFSKAPEILDGDKWFEGLALIEKKFRSILEAEGVSEIDAEGQMFDPALHEAVMREESDEYEEGEIIEVLQKGYILGERVVRPARVRVAG